MSHSKKVFVKESGGLYRATQPLSPDDIIQKAREISARRFQRGTDALGSPDKVRDYLSLHLGSLEHEEFWGIFLDNRHRVIARECLFAGTIDGCAVYPREVIKRVLRHNAAALIFAHNHPSGLAKPSDADIAITKKLSDALLHIDVRVLDHLIVGSEEQTSLAEQGLL